MKEYIQPAGVQAWVSALFNVWTTIGRYSVEVADCVFCHSSAGDSICHYSRCSVLSFYGSQLVPHLWEAGYRMQDPMSFLGADAIFDDVQRIAPLIAAWLDAAHWTVLAHTRGHSVEELVKTMAARLKVFLINLCKGAEANKYMAEAIRPHAATTAQWT